MNRRQAIQLGIGGGLAAGAGLWAGYELLPPSPSRALAPVDVLASRLYRSLDAEQRSDTVVDYDHPLRQYHNRGVWGGGREVVFGFSRRQRQILTDLLHAGLSPEGRTRIPKEFFTRIPGVNSMKVLIAGDPTNPPYQIVLTGAHVNLRVGGPSREGAAFGGPQVYGDQRGDYRPGLPGNLYREQFVLAEQLLRGMNRSQRGRALIGEAPVQTGIELQGSGGFFPGVQVAELHADLRIMARSLVEEIHSTYPIDDARFANACLDANGGVESLSLSFYTHGEDGDIPEGQVFRLEGPAAVYYFRGYPHVHAFINVAIDGDAPLSAGEPLGVNPRWLDREGVQRLFETSMKVETASDAAYYDADSVAGRLRAGLIRSGDIYSLESWQESVEIVEIRGANLSERLRERFTSGGRTIDEEKPYTVATTRYDARERQEKLGRINSRRRGPMLRDLVVDYLREHGFGDTYETLPV